jgi:hypothetical protein
MTTLHPSCETAYLKEPGFSMFLSSGLICMTARNPWSGNINGYVSIGKQHPFFGKEYGDKVHVTNLEEVKFNGNYIGLLCLDIDEAEAGLISIDMALDVHGGITYSSSKFPWIDSEIFKDIWVFGFDTAHAGDLKPLQGSIDRQFNQLGDEYRDYEYVKGECTKLAEQLSMYK